jgi:hypothetical protein
MLHEQDMNNIIASIRRNIHGVPDNAPRIATTATAGSCANAM